MSALMTIPDLQGNWQHHLDTIKLLGVWFDDLKRYENTDVSFNVFIPSERTREPGVHASEVSGCMRRFVYALSGFERKLLPSQVDVNMKRRFSIGHVIHAMTQAELTRMVMMFGNGYVEFIDEVKIDPSTNEFTRTYMVYSHSDGLFTFFDANFNPVIRLILEIKTESDKEFEKLTAPRQSHIEQAHIYMRSLDAPVTWFLYYNKSSSLWTPPAAPWLITYDRKLEAQLENRIQAGYKMAYEHSLPQAEEGFSCGWCPFAYDCKPTYLATMGRKSTRPGRL